jgi:hypothetical protein
MCHLPILIVAPGAYRLREQAAIGSDSQASSDRHGVQAWAPAASRLGFQFQGKSRSSSWAMVRPETTRSSTSVNHAKGSTPFNFAVATRLATIAMT